ncbi:copine-8-like isoform X1 [Amphibalanus amphitrite]|uniref:copine-8-like isoform X1 n=1 Tax=Amphibalanus amphitrite TaxID=1232801 RepID=UPI001C904494|nr:copine-8-like isoform X1 [Amphibalanus amphitrite]XP_043210500.1 copine-8-like isoform X1 [Amphibalanus amphitrite]XP_043210501.1 copine-8-like isoform X1 [Amphibalanus amphitrite]XP_043210502.1 copine-8-like isoform X1 [Amphibalanus amphitrite]
MQNFTGGSAAVPVTQVELTLSCRHLADMDVFSKSDPMVVVSVAPFGSSARDRRWDEYKRTEVVQDNLNPDFATKVPIAYRFEEQQFLRFDVYDVDSSSARLEEHDFLGRRECTLGELVSARVSELPLQGGPPSGAQPATLIVHAEEMLGSKEEAVLQFCGRKLDKKDWLWGKSDPYLELFKSTEEGQWVLVSRTEVLKRTLNPDWRPVTVSVGSLCNGDYQRNIRAVCWDWNASGTPDLIGECFFTLQQLRDATKPAAFDCINKEKQARKGSSYRNSGQIILQSCQIRVQHTFLDYIQGGTELACTIAIDFTASNGNPMQPDSLHYLGRDAAGRISNPYVTALRAVGNIIQDYDSDKQFPVLGFGARVPPAGIVSHEFFVNIGAETPFCYGIEGVVAAYERCLPQIQLYGPTNFAPVIQHVANFASRYRDGSQYFILLIITDGVITDMPQTKQAIVSASSLPLSIIIVGVGGAEFDAMEELDGDEVRLTAGGRAAQRDIVQFVPLRRLSGGDPAAVRTRLAREVLAEVPAQFLGYMRSAGIQPQPPRAAPVPLPPDPQLV